jgi:hypothetical protein
MVRTSEMDSKVIETLLADVKRLKNPELEIRFGQKDARKTFVSEIPHDTWSIVLKRLRSNPKWSSVSSVSFVDSLCKDTGARHRSCEDKWIVKKRIMVRDIPMDSMDIRVGLSEEVPMPSQDAPDQSIIKNIHKVRHRFVHKDMWAFDLTEATGYDIDQETPWYYIELELVPESLSKYPDRYVADYGVLLIHDVLSMVRPK